jgi:hypothetical protein
VKGGVFGFSRKEIIWFAVILLSSLAIIAFCVFRIVDRFYRQSEENGARIRKLSSEVLHLQEMSMHAVTIQRSSLNLIIYEGRKQELEQVLAGLAKNKDTLSKDMASLISRGILDLDVTEKITSNGKNYLVMNREFCEMVSDSLRRSGAADFNVEKMRPALRKLSDLIRSTSMDLTNEIHLSAEAKVNLLSLFEFWLLMLVLVPYVYLFYRFIRLFIKVLTMDAKL